MAFSLCCAGSFHIRRSVQRCVFILVKSFPLIYNRGENIRNQISKEVNSGQFLKQEVKMKLSEIDHNLAVQSTLDMGERPVPAPACGDGGESESGGSELKHTYSRRPCPVSDRFRVCGGEGPAQGCPLDAPYAAYRFPWPGSVRL